MTKSVVLLALLATGCAGNGVHPLRPQELATAPYRTTVAAEFTGSLLYEGGCLLFRDDQNRVQLLPLWPSGSAFNGTSVIFHQPGKAEQRIVVGEEFHMAGEQGEWRALAGGGYERFERQCGAAPFFVSEVHPAN